MFPSKILFTKILTGQKAPPPCLSFRKYWNQVLAGFGNPPEIPTRRVFGPLTGRGGFRKKPKLGPRAFSGKLNRGPKGAVGKTPTGGGPLLGAHPPGKTSSERRDFIFPPRGKTPPLEKPPGKLSGGGGKINFFCGPKKRGGGPTTRNKFFSPPPWEKKTPPQNFGWHNNQWVAPAGENKYNMVCLPPTTGGGLSLPVTERERRSPARFFYNHPNGGGRGYTYNHSRRCRAWSPKKGLHPNPRFENRFENKYY